MEIDQSAPIGWVKMSAADVPHGAKCKYRNRHGAALHRGVYFATGAAKRGIFDAPAAEIKIQPAK